MKILQILFIIIFCLIVFALPVFAIDPPCTQAPDKDTIQCKFGTISPPPVLDKLLQKDSTGAEGISLFLSNLIALFFSLAAVILVLMIIWGAFDWLISEGDKEKIQGAQKKIINAIIGIILFAVAFAIIRVLGQFTGFTFFKGQNDPPFIQNRGPARGTTP